jgi:hypothetical protein
MRNGAKRDLMSWYMLALHCPLDILWFGIPQCQSPFTRPNEPFEFDAAITETK